MLFKYKFKNRAGFTLVELLVVMAVMEVMVGGLFLILNPGAQMGKARDAKRKAELVDLQKALEVYYQDYGRYPASIAGTYRITGVNWGGAWGTYMERVPVDPTSPTRKYVYYTPNTGHCANYQCYYLYANLETNNDPQLCFPATGAPCNSAAGFADKCGDTSHQCNYGVSSSNATP